MSVKHVRQYYNEICSQYHEMIENIKDLEIEAANGMVEPERISRLQDVTAPLKQNYERMCYVMFLLNQPNKKSKQKKYNKYVTKASRNLDPSNSLESVLAENSNVLDSVGK